MTPPSSDDDWNDLARELGVDKSAPPPPEAPPADMVERQVDAEFVEPHHTLGDHEDEMAAEGDPETATDEELGDGDEASPVEGESPADGTPGTGRKRRRRRRRRRKAGAAPEADAAEIEATEGTEEEAEEDFAVVAEEPVAEDDFSAEDEDAYGPLAAEEEDTASDVLRDLIASWNVPSWDDIVGGLYRPER